MRNPTHDRIGMPRAEQIGVRAAGHMFDVSPTRAFRWVHLKLFYEMVGAECPGRNNRHGQVRR